MNVRVLLLATALVGCSEHTTTVVSDASTEPWVVDAPDLDVLDAGRCVVEKITACPPVSDESTVFTADTSSSIVAVHPPFVLLDPLRVAYVGSSGAPAMFAPLEPVDATLRAVSIAYGNSRAIVLGCGASACRVFELITKEPAPGLVRLGPELPTSTRAITVHQDAIWVAGDGVRRLDGTSWSMERAEGRFHALAAATTTDGATLVAVGEGGLVAVRAHDTWTTTNVGVNDTLTQVALHDYVIATASERGDLFLGTRSGFQACTGPTLGVRTLQFVDGPGLRFLFGTTNDAHAFTLDAAGSACQTEELPGLRGGAMFTCGVVPNRWRFTATEVVGTNHCAID